MLSGCEDDILSLINHILIDVQSQFVETDYFGKHSKRCASPTLLEVAQMPFNGEKAEAL